jgi:hypothetical protein
MGHGDLYAHHTGGPDRGPAQHLHPGPAHLDAGLVPQAAGHAGPRPARRRASRARGRRRGAQGRQAQGSSGGGPPDRAHGAHRRPGQVRGRDGGRHRSGSGCTCQDARAPGRAHRAGRRRRLRRTGPRCRHPLRGRTHGHEPERGRHCRPHRPGDRPEPRDRAPARRPGRRCGADDSAGRVRPHTRPASRAAGSDAAARTAGFDRADVVPHGGERSAGGSWRAPASGRLAASRCQDGRDVRDRGSCRAQRREADRRARRHRRSGTSRSSRSASTVPAPGSSPTSRTAMSGGHLPSCSTERC